MAIIWVAGAAADGGPHQRLKDYNQTTKRCAGCHRAHTAEGAGLIRATSSLALCTTCHHDTNGGSDVMRGVAYTSNPDGFGNAYPLRGGGFEQSIMNTSLAATAPVSGTGFLQTKSAHAVNGMNVPGTSDPYTGGTIWGIGAVDSGPGGTGTFKLECSTCHDPHGGSGITATGQVTETFRILRGDIASKVSSVGVAGARVTVLQTALKVDKYITPTLPLDLYYGVPYDNLLRDTSADGGATSYANLGTALNQWCSVCHTRIGVGAGAGAGHTDSNDDIYTFRHPTDGIDVTTRYPNTTFDPATAGKPGCMTCHVAHGSPAAFQTDGDYRVEIPGGDRLDDNGSFLDSTLLRLDNRGVCQSCHNK